MSTTASGRASVPAQASPAAAGPTQPSTVIDLDAPRPAAPARTRTDRVRDALHAGACVLAGVLVTVGFLLDPATDADGGAEILAVVGDDPTRFYLANTLGAFGLVMAAAVGLAVLRLVRGRGRAVATVGGMLVLIGGTASGAALFMYGSVLTAMSESGLDAATMAELQDSFADSPRPGLAFVIGFPALFLGLVVCVVALLMSGAVARWVPAALVLGMVVVMALGDTVFSTVGDLLLTAGFAGIGLTLWRQTDARPS